MSETEKVQSPGKDDLSLVAIKSFKSLIYSYYHENRRSFSWRDEISPYRVFISEVMLQQTQTARVADKFEEFIDFFPSFEELARAPFNDVLRLWKGLGYNRRAKFLHDAAGVVAESFDGHLPEDPAALQSLPGIGPATAASICVFAYNMPLVFLETNIRTVFIHFFFSEREKVKDRELLPLVEAALDRKYPRDWYYALMDYGVMLKKTVGNLTRKSSTYTRQSRFDGSDRQLRGKILQLLLDLQTVSLDDLSRLLGEPQDRCERLVEALCTEGVIRNNHRRLQIS